MSRSQEFQFGYANTNRLEEAGRHLHNMVVHTVNALGAKDAASRNASIKHGSSSIDMYDAAMRKSHGSKREKVRGKVNQPRQKSYMGMSQN